jgi:hypothetical protein
MLQFGAREEVVHPFIESYVMCVFLDLAYQLTSRVMPPFTGGVMGQAPRSALVTHKAAFDAEGVQDHKTRHLSRADAAADQTHLM